MDTGTLLTVFTAAGTILGAIAAVFSVVVAKRVAATQVQLSQRQLLIPLWDYLSTLKRIDPTPGKLIEPDVIKAVNTLELVALCVESGAVDARLIRRTFRDHFVQIYDVVDSLPPMEGIKKSGKELLKENPAAMNFYRELNDEHMKRDKVKRLPVGG